LYDARDLIVFLKSFYPLLKVEILSLYPFLLNVYLPAFDAYFIDKVLELSILHLHTPYQFIDLQLKLQEKPIASATHIEILLGRNMSAKVSTVRCLVLSAWIQSDGPVPKSTYNTFIQRKLHVYHGSLLKLINIQSSF
jgi:hypothetical protein